jgi:hypothetical protein
VIEKVLLGAILIVVLVAVVRTVMRAVNSSEDSKPAGCTGCPFDSKCVMQDRPHTSECGSDEGE